MESKTMSGTTASDGATDAPEFVIRSIPEEDALQRAFITGYAFAEERGEGLVRGLNRSSSLTWTRGLYMEGDLVAALLIEPYAIWLEGSEAQMYGISDVACLPEQRRQGHVGRLLRATLAEMHERGVPLSGLYTPHVPLYRRFGWEPATRQYEIRLPIKQTRLHPVPSPAGRIERIEPDDWRRLDAIYTAAGRAGNSGLKRWESRWLQHVLGGEHRPHDAPIWHDAAVWVDGSGADRGYAVYRETGWQNNLRGNLRVREMMTLDADAEHGLTAYLLTHDLSQDAIFTAIAPDAPLLHRVDDPGLLTVTSRHGLLLRLVDLPSALLARPCYAPEGSRVIVDVTDIACPWNAGRWQISGEGGLMRAVRSTGEPDLSLDVSMLATLYNGGQTPESAALAGRVQVHRHEALATAHNLFAMRFAPHCVEFF